MKLNFGIFIFTFFIFGKTFCLECPFAALSGPNLDKKKVDNHNKHRRSVFGQNDVTVHYFNSAEEFSAIINSLTTHKRNDKCPVMPNRCSSNLNNYYYRTFDGSCNNFHYPSYGMANRGYTRLVKPNYRDGYNALPLSKTGQVLPSPVTLSSICFVEQTVADDRRTLITTYWGQTVAHDLTRNIVDNRSFNCCDHNGSNMPKCFPIRADPRIPHQGFDTCTHFLRGTTDVEENCDYNRKGYAEKLSAATAFLDLSILYADSDAGNSKMRVYHGGLLKTSQINEEAFPKITRENCATNNASQCESFVLSDLRQSFFPPTVVIQITLLREHNRCARILAQLNPHWNDEKLFQEARKINIAQYQKITYYDYLTMVIGKQFALNNRLIYNVKPNSYVNDYNPHTDATTYAEFSGSAFRHGHFQIPGWFLMLSQNHDIVDYKRLNDFVGVSKTFNFISKPGAMEALVRGLINQIQKKADQSIDHEIKHIPLIATNKYGVDLKALDIQRGRDFGLATYNTMRVLCGLKRAVYWQDFSDVISPHYVRLLQELYPTPDDVDLSVGGSLEKHLNDTLFGHTFSCILAKQFSKTRTGDRFFFEHENALGGFNRAQLAEIRKSTLSGLLCANDVNLKAIQTNAFEYPTAHNPVTSCSNIHTIDLSKWKESPTYVSHHA